MPGITVKYSAADYQRVRAAMGRRLDLGRVATDEETENAVHSFIARITADYERDDAAKAARATIVEPMKSAV